MIFSVIIAFVIGALLILFSILYLQHLNKSSLHVDDLKQSENKISIEAKNKKILKDRKRTTKTDGKFQFSHPWLVSILKGHTANILDFDISSSGRHILSVASDRSLYMWKVKHIWHKDKKIVRSNVTLDHATRVRFSPDDKACIVSLGVENIIRVMKIKKETNTYSFTGYAEFPKTLSADIINIGIACTGNFIMTCHSNTMVGVWSLKGQLLQTIDTGNMINYFGIVSPCGRFVASTGFAPDARVWAIEFDKTKTFKQITRAFELKGHNSGILELCFTHDSTKAATISKDGTWRLWNIGIDIKCQDPVLLKIGKYNYNNTEHVHITLSASGHCLCIAQNKDIYFVDTTTGEIKESLQEAHSDVVTALAYEPKNKIFFSSGGKYINVYNDMISRQVEMRQLQEKLRKCNEDKYQKQRIINQIKEAELIIDNLLANKTQVN